MRRFLIVGILFASLFLACGKTKENTFRFCRNFSEAGCTEVLSEKAFYKILPSNTKKTMRDFWNSVYFRGDRLAFEIQNTKGKTSLDKKCLRGTYTVQASHTEEIEYTELRGKSVFGLAMLGSLLEKKFSMEKNSPYHPPAPFSVSYAVYCNGDLLANATILLEMR